MEPVAAAEFAVAIGRLGPWDAARRVAVAVSGGPDSLALALLAEGWGQPLALIVDHGLRATAAAEAEQTRAALAARGMPARVLTLRGLHHGPALAARARAARYEALAEACRAEGLVDLLLGHHAGDQAETVLMRRRRGSGPAGLAGMAALAEQDWGRLVRPLLGIPPERLRATVTAAGLVPVEDPSNADMRTARARLRQEIGQERAALLDAARTAGTARRERDAAVAAALAESVAIHPEGYARFDGPLPPDALAVVLRSVSGRRYPVRVPPDLAAAPRACTLAGARLLPAGRLGRGWLAVREAASMAPPVQDGVWDGRFRARLGEGETLGALGAEARRRRERLPAAVLATLPALRGPGRLLVPHLAQGMVWPAALPMCCAAFMP